MSHELPSGTLTFLFTDLGDSTRAWEAQPDDMRAAVARHDDIVRWVIAAHDGHFVKSLGDGVMAVFESAGDAVAAAVDIQLGLDAEQWAVPIAVRIGLHTGEARADNGDYHAPAVNRAAGGVANAAHPGQILVTGATAALAEEWTLDDLGEHELRGIGVTRLLQVRAPGLRDAFPAPAALRVISLPSPATSFVGRDAEIEAIIALLEQHRVVTITGAGGCGKTRLAIEVASRVGVRRRDGARFVDLAPIGEDGQVADAVVDAIGLATGVVEESLDRLTAYLRERDTLLVLDNCEHLLDAAADLAESVVARAPNISLIVTSREPLSVDGEQVYRVPSFASETDGVSLFAERGSEARDDFRVDDANRAVVVEVCKRLDGIPLAIELAAAMVAHLAPAQVLERLDDRFRLLTGGRRRVQRHQTLAATLDWSHELLAPEEQDVFRRLAVFSASFSLEAAHAVVARPDTVEQLGSLVAKSLVHVVGDGDRLRYRMLETVRLYAQEKLVGAGEADECRTRQRDWVRDWIESFPLVARWIGDRDYLGEELANIRSAIDWSIARDDIDALGAFAGGVDWSRSEAWREGFRACTLAFPEPVVTDDASLQVCMMLFWLGPIAFDLALEWGEPAIASVDAFDEPRPLHALAMSGHGRNLTVPAVRDNDAKVFARSVELAEAGVALSMRFDPAWQKVCCFLSGMGFASLDLLDRASELFMQGAATEPSGPPYAQLQSALEGYLSLMKYLLGSSNEALELARRAESRIGGLAVTATIPYWHHSRQMAFIVALGDSADQAEAREQMRVYYEMQRLMDWKWGAQSTAILGATLAVQRGDWDIASRLLAFAEPGVGRTPADWLLDRYVLRHVRDALPQQRRRALREEGRALSEREAIGLALA